MCMWPEILIVRLYQRALYDFWFWDCLEGTEGYHEFTDGFNYVSALNVYLPKGIISGPPPNDHYYLWIYLCQEELHGNTDQINLVPTSFCERLRRSYLKDIVMDISDLIVFEMLLLFCDFFTDSVFTGVLSKVPGYYSSLETMLAHICTRHRSLPVHHWVTVALFPPFFCVLTFVNTLYTRWMRPLVCVSSQHFCRIGCRPSGGCMFILHPLWGLSSTHMNA